MIEQALQRLYRYCRANAWKGWDPYDGLNSRVFRAAPLIRRSRLCRLAWIQLFKRSPINLRPMALVPPGENPKGLALFGRGLARLARAGCDWIESGDVAHVFERLKVLRSPGYAEWCWGYDFDWQGRAFFVGRFQPNAVATTFAAQAFLDRFEWKGDAEGLEIARSAGTFILGGLRRTHETPGAVCFSYTPFDATQIHNINFLIAALFARVAAVGDDPTAADWARRVLAYVIARQADDGAWPYGTYSYQNWIDHFHTCYNLLALDECRRHLDSDEYEKALERGLAFYLDHLFRDDGLPRHDTRSDWPIDIHSVALALMTLTRFADRAPACRARREKIVEWALRAMQDRDGYFYYQKREHSTVRIPYMRWSQAWMFEALSLLVTSGQS